MTRVRDGKIEVPVTPDEYRSISQAMMIYRRSLIPGGRPTDGELLAEICRAWMRARGSSV